MISEPRFIAIGTLTLALFCACQGEQEQEQRVRTEMKSTIDEQLNTWLEASKSLRDAAPAPQDDGWDPVRDAAALDAMKAAWGRSREAYERVEGAVAGIFPESDTATDARYEDYLLVLGAVGDPAPFDGEGVIGMHGIERILWADSIPESVITFERGLPGYRAAAFPSTRAEAVAFRDGLATRLVEDIEALRGSFEPLTLDVAFAFRGLIDLAAEQVEKVDKASSGEEESRYAQTTMRDLWANYEGCKRAYDIFRPWVLSKSSGRFLDGQVTKAFERLHRAYSEVSGPAIPEPPSGFSSLEPSPDLLNSPFGRLYEVVKREADPSVEDSLHASLIEIATVLELPAPVTD